MQTPPGTDETDFPRLLEEIPLLYKARAFADGLSASSWFMRLGETLDERELSLARDYLDGLGFPEAEPAQLDDWSEAAEAAETQDRDPAGWEAEEMLRAGLTERAPARLDEEALATVLNYVTAKAGESARDAAEDAAAMGGATDEALINAAAGALVQAAHGAALVVLAEAGDENPPHPFLARWRLFARGRWPVGLAGASYNIL